MKCSHCSNDLQDTATICPQCGVSTGQSKENLQQPPKTFSYLPPGTPPWPTTITDHKHDSETGSYANTGNVQHQRTPILPIPTGEHKNTGLLKMLSILIAVPLVGSLITLGLLYANGQFIPGSSSHSAPIQGVYNNSTTSSNTTDPDAPSASTPQATATAPATSTATQTAGQPGQIATLPATKSFKSSTNKDINMSLRYPSDWSLGQVNQTNSTAITLPIQPPQNYRMQIYIEHLTPTFSTFFNDASELNRRNIQSLFQLQNAHDIQKISAQDARPTIADTVWEQGEATLQVGTSPKLHFTSISVQHNGSYYSTYFLIPDNIYQAALQKYMQPLLASMKFLS